jgi:hypothetical protein
MFINVLRVLLFGCLFQQKQSKCLKPNTDQPSQPLRFQDSCGRNKILEQKAALNMSSNAHVWIIKQKDNECSQQPLQLITTANIKEFVPHQSSHSVEKHTRFPCFTTQPELHIHSHSLSHLYNRPHVHYGQCKQATERHDKCITPVWLIAFLQTWRSRASSERVDHEQSTCALRGMDHRRSDSVSPSSSKR